MADRVEKYELFAVEPRWVFLKITTAEGLVGWRGLPKAAPM